MLVVLPVHAGDVALAERNLVWLRSLEPQGDPHHALIAAEEGTQTDALLNLAAKHFVHVSVWTYAPWTGNKVWPHPQNYAWQAIAVHLAHLKHPDSWFWWEADVTPLVPDWLSTLEAEHAHGRKPFTGRVGHDGYMGGVAIYPPNVMEYSTNAFLVRAEPFDSALGKDIRSYVHLANHLMAHFPRYSSVKVHVEDPDVPRLLRAKGYILFHGCNDGSLIDVIQGRKPTPPSGGITRLYGTADIDSPHDGTESMWQYDALELEKRHYPVLPFAKCAEDFPSLVDQASAHGWKAGLFALPHTSSEVHYNAAITRTPGSLTLLTRRWLRDPRGTWKSDLVRWELDQDLYSSAPQPLTFTPRDPLATYEDPRIVTVDGRHWVSYCVWRQGRLFRSHQALSAFNLAWQHLSTLNVPYAGNGWHTGSGTGHEKNWVWFRHDGVWHFVYCAHPHTVVRVTSPSQLTEYIPPPRVAEMPWPYGEIHGGTPPIRAGNEYVTFFHSSLAWQGRKKRYYMGAYAFEARHPFAMTRLTRHPLLRGSDKDPRTLGGPLCVFPCGAVFEDGEWLLSMGVNDEATAWARIPHADLDRLLEPL